MEEGSGMDVGCAECAEPQAAVIVACGGVGSRFWESSEDLKRSTAEESPPGKQFVLLAGKPVLAYTLSVLEAHPRIAMVILVLPRRHVQRGEALVNGLWPEDAPEKYQKVKLILEGGKDRQESVDKGLSALADFAWEGPVLVQDGVRPCTTAQIYDRVVQGVITRGNAIPAIPVRDTIKRADASGTIKETLDRQGLWQIQTPQGFWMRDLREAYDEGRRRGLRVTDDASLMEALGRQVYLVEGDPVNIKLTYNEDMVLLEALLSRA